MIINTYLISTILLFSCYEIQAQVFELKAKSTLTVTEMNVGEKMYFKLISGRKISFILKDFHSEIIFSSLDVPRKGGSDEVKVYKMECLVNIDGQDMKMIRYIPTQQSFYVPYVVNGLRIWFDGLNDVGKYFKENHGECLPYKNARFVFQDATLPICPEKILTWCNLSENFLSIKNCYIGLDCWMGPYNGEELHGGLDIRMPSNSPLWTPISLDNNYYYKTRTSTGRGNGWCGIKNWDNGDTWIIKTYHILAPIASEFKSLRQGEKYAYGAGTAVGLETHSHFIFNIKTPNQKVYFIDPWIIFWQIFENRKVLSGQLIAAIAPLEPTITGKSVLFSSEASQKSVSGSDPEYYWSFGDGDFSILKNPVHPFLSPGIYPVTLMLYDGVNYSSTTQNITVNGTALQKPKFSIISEKNLSFNPRRNWEMDTYGKESTLIPNTVTFSTVEGSNKSVMPKIITITTDNAPKIDRYFRRIDVIYKQDANWLTLKEIPGKKKNQFHIEITPDISKLNKRQGHYEAFIVIHFDMSVDETIKGQIPPSDAEEFLNSPQLIRVVVDFSRPEKGKITVIDNKDTNCIFTNYSWLNVDVELPWCQGYKGDFLINADRDSGSTVRYVPNLSQGKYKVELLSPVLKTKKMAGRINKFYVNVKTANRIERILVNPMRSLELGTFSFDASKNSYVEICTDGSDGLIIADAVKFERVE